MCLACVFMFIFVLCPGPSSCSCEKSKFLSAPCWKLYAGLLGCSRSPQHCSLLFVTFIPVHLTLWKIKNFTKLFFICYKSSFRKIFLQLNFLNIYFLFQNFLKGFLLLILSLISIPYIVINFMILQFPPLFNQARLWFIILIGNFELKTQKWVRSHQSRKIF